MDPITNRHLGTLLERIRQNDPLIEGKRSAKNPPPAADQLDAYFVDLITSVCKRLDCDETNEDDTIDLVLSVIADAVDQGQISEIPDTDTAKPQEIMQWLATAQQLQLAALVVQAADDVLADLAAEDAAEEATAHPNAPVVVEDWDPVPAETWD